LQFLRGFLAPLFQSGDLATRPIAAGEPGLTFLVDSVQTFRTHLGVAEMGLQFGACRGDGRAVLSRRRARRVEARGELRLRIQLGESGFCLRALLEGFVACPVKADNRFL